MHTSSMSVSPKRPPFESSATIPAVAADIGLAVTAACDAMTEIESGRSGRSFTFRETSAMIGSSEYEWPVPTRR